MTYKILQNSVKGLLVGDNVLPKDPDIILAQLAMAYNEIANKCPVLTLMTLDNTDEILRLGSGSYKIRVPELPESDEDELDIDDDLGFAAAYLIASYVSKNKKPFLMQEADRKMLAYNAKVYDIQSSYRPNDAGDRYELP